MIRSIRACAVVLHYGDPSLTRRVRDQLLAADPDRAKDIRVLDNAAPLPFEPCWQRLEQNLYWAGALAWTMEHLEEQYTHLWFLNNDISFSGQPPLLSRAEARLEWIEKRLGPVGAYSPSALRNPYHPQMIQDASQQIRCAACIDGIAPLFHLGRLRQCGGIDHEDNPYGYGVDVITSLRLHRAGHLVVVDHQLPLRHTYHSTARNISGFMEKAAKAEARYLASRLGTNYAHQLEQFKKQYTDHKEL
ncbi:MAG: hypothetical protein V3573_10770 [Desulfovibrionaceae bacterium]